MINLFVDSVNYGDMNYSSNDPATIALTVRYDNAVQTPDATGIGTAVGRTLGTNATGVS